MKKMVFCLLTLVIILSGCTQRINTENEQNNQIKKEYVDKLDDSKDWVHMKDESSFDSDIDIENWITTKIDNSDSTYEEININIDSEDAKKFNEAHTINLDNPNASGIEGTGACRYKWYVYQDVLVVLKKAFVGMYKTEVYMYDLITGSQIKLDELLSQYGQTAESASNSATTALIEKGYKIIGRDDIGLEDPSFIADDFGPSPYPNYSSIINEKSTIYISPLGKLSLLVEIKQYVANENTYTLEMVNVEKNETK